MADGKFVAYYRVSTAQQGHSGLGLDAQREAVMRYLSNGGWPPLAEFTEIETGKGANALDRRPQLKAALAYARKHKATLIIAKLDRLARNAIFILELKRSEVEFIACDIPEASTFTIGLMAILAQQERELISARTKAALAAKKRRGETLGKPENFKQEGRIKGSEAMKAKASGNLNNRRATGYAKSLKEQGLTLQAIADKLNAEGYETARGKMFEKVTVKRLLER